MLKIIVLSVICFLIPVVLFANDNGLIEEGSVSYYLSTSSHSNCPKNFDPLTSLLHENLISGFTRAVTKCYFKQIDPKVRCPDYTIGHASMKTGTPRTKICTAAKRAIISPRGCQRKHCTPCVYANI